MIECPKCHMQCPDDALYCGDCAAPLPRPDSGDPFVGLCIDDKYIITKRIASGGMGIVYLARQKGTGQYVAIKKLHAEHYRDKVIVERFMDEARSYGRITHPNAVKLHDLLNVNGQICIVMEYVAGKTLTQYLELGKIFSLRQIADISLQIADALGTVHRAGIIHRDLKTENIMLVETVSGRFSVKILDFGIAKMLGKPSDRRTKEGIIVGTPEFMSPEQCFGTDIDGRTDIYAFGILMYAMICNRLPYSCESPMGLLQMQISAPLPDLQRLTGEPVPDALKRLVHKCMMKSRDDRYASFDEVIDDLTQIQESGLVSLASRAAAPEVGGRTVADEAGKTIDDSFSFSIGESESDGAGAASLVMETQTGDSLDFELDAAFEESFGERKPGEDKMRQRGEDAPPAPKTPEKRAAGEDSAQCNRTAAGESDGKKGGAAAGGPTPQEELSADDGGEGFSLGDISELDDAAPPQARKTPNRAKPAVAAAIVAIIVACAAAIAFWMRPADAPESERAAETIAPEASAAPPAAEGSDEERRAAAPPVAPAQPEPIEASRIASRDVLMRGVARACIAQSLSEANAGNLDEAQSLADFSQSQSDALSPSDVDELAKSREYITSLRGIMQSAQASGDKCGRIEALIDRTPAAAAGMKEKLSDIARKCRRKLEAPPMTL